MEEVDSCRAAAEGTMRKYSDVISWLAVLLGLGLLSTIVGSSWSAVAAGGLILFCIGMYRIINNAKRKEMMDMFFKIEQLPEDKRQATVAELVRKTKPETWH
jgi:hypothetical protein